MCIAPKNSIKINLTYIVVGGYVSIKRSWGDADRNILSVQRFGSRSKNNHAFLRRHQRTLVI